MFCVIKQGVYMHGTYGPCETEQEARELAQELAMQDTDDYHSWDVYALSRDGLDDEPLASYQKWGVGWNLWDKNLPKDARSRAEWHAYCEHDRLGYAPRPKRLWD